MPRRPGLRSGLLAMTFWGMGMTSMGSENDILRSPGDIRKKLLNNIPEIEEHEDKENDDTYSYDHF